MALDDSKNSENSQEKFYINNWKKITGDQFSKLKSVSKPLLKRYWKFHLAFLIALFVSYFSSNNWLRHVKCVFVQCGKCESPEHRDVSSALSSMEPLLEIEQNLVKALNKYANELQQKLDTIRSGLQQMRKPDEIENIDAEKFLGNPLNSFPMLRRLKSEWGAWEGFLQKPVGNAHIKSIQKTLKRLSDYDIMEAAVVIDNIRDVYDIQPADWMVGTLLQRNYERKFNVLDAFSVAYLLYVQEKYLAADEWFLAALHSYEHSDIYPFMRFNRSYITESYADNFIKQNQTNLALMLIKVALNNEPNNYVLLKKKKEIENMKNKVQQTDEKVGNKHNKNDANELTRSIESPCKEDYIANTSAELFCYYNSSGSDFLRLAPFKVEQVLFDPPIVLYHDIINDNEIDNIKHLAKKTLKRSDQKGVLSKTERFSKISWLHDNNSKDIDHIQHRIQDIIGLEIGEPLLVGNYGLGGYHKEHIDCLALCDSDKSICDSRLMTVLIYLSDVESGGGTIFPSLNVGALPQKGTVLTWYNLLNDMETCDERALHMDCPVVVGSKWFAVQWVKRNAQTFKKPCYRNISTIYESKENN